MRYVAKVYVLDVLDHVIVSGYVRDADAHDVPDEDPFEFTWQVPGEGHSDPRQWLASALTRSVHLP